MDFSKFIPERVKKIPTHMDFKGQKQAEFMFQVIILTFATVGFTWGYICQQFSQTMYILIAGFALACVLTIPPWPMYRKTPLKWQKARPSPEEIGSSGSVSSPSTGSSSAQKSKKKK